MSQSNEFFAALAKVIQTGDTATLSATTACWRLASISVKAGEVFALRYGDRVGLDALPAFKSIQVESFSHKPDCSDLLYKPIEKPVSTQLFLNAMRDRIIRLGTKPSHPVPSPESQATESSPATPAQQLTYRGQPVRPVSKAPADTQKKSAKVRTWAIQYPESKVPQVPQMNYRGKPVRPASEQQPAPDQNAAPAKTWETRYRGNPTNPFRRRDGDQAA